MIGKSRAEYVFIRISIAALRLIAPASIIYLIASWRYAISPWFAIYPIAEASFFLFVYLPRNIHLQKECCAAEHPQPLSRQERQTLFNKCLSYVTTDVYPSRWFFSTGIQKDNVIDWLLWALFSSDRAHASPEWSEEIEGYVAAIERVRGNKLPYGHNGGVKSMRVTLDPVVMVHRPLLWYGIVAIVDTYTSLSLYHHGFRHYATPKWFRIFPPRPWTLFSRPSASRDISYWYRPSRSNVKLPVVFIHGIGIGLYPYTPLLRELSTMDVDDDTGVLAIELLPISMRMTPPILHRASICLAISQILASHNIDRFVVAGHSFGTVITAHLLRSPDLGPRIAAMLLIDPIPFLLHLPDVAYNFVYRSPRTANEWQLWYFASRDPDASRSISRHFFWMESVLWKEDLEGRLVGVSLSGCDQIVGTEEVRKYLTGEGEMKEMWEKSGLQVLFYPDLDHAMVFDTKDRRFPLVNILRKFVRVDQVTRTPLT